jgi:pyruvate ferredoxin oxidoreductase delta subunit
MTNPKKTHSPHADQRAGQTCRHENKSWRDLPLGAVVTDPGSSRDYDTGNWSQNTCAWKKESCINCNLCWPACPDEAILTDTDGNMLGVDADKCKACGLCVTACPTQPKSLEIVKKVPKKI